jgi:hypothetical protein
MATGPVNNNPYLQQILFQNLSSSTVQPGQVKDSTALLNSAMSAKASVATISSSGAKINNISNVIKNSGDMQAYEGFQASISRAVSSSDPIRTIRLLNSADYTAKNDAQALSDSFSSLAQTVGKDNSSLIDSFNSAFTSTVEKTGTEGLVPFNKAFAQVKDADYGSAGISLDQNLKQFFTAVSAVNSSSRSSEENISNLQRLARGVELEESADSIWNFFNEFIGIDPEKGIA